MSDACKKQDILHIFVALCHDGYRIKHTIAVDDSDKCFDRINTPNILIHMGT